MPLLERIAGALLLCCACASGGEESELLERAKARIDRSFAGAPDEVTLAAWREMRRVLSLEEQLYLEHAPYSAITGRRIAADPTFQKLVDALRGKSRPLSALRAALGPPSQVSGSPCQPQPIANPEVTSDFDRLVEYVKERVTECYTGCLRSTDPSIVAAVVQAYRELADEDQTPDVIEPMYLGNWQCVEDIPTQGFESKSQCEFGPFCVTVIDYDLPLEQRNGCAGTEDELAEAQSVCRESSQSWHVPPKDTVRPTPPTSAVEAFCCDEQPVFALCEDPGQPYHAFCEPGFDVRAGCSAYDALGHVCCMERIGLECP